MLFGPLATKRASAQELVGWVAVEVSLNLGVSKSDLRLSPVPILLCLASCPL
jgi:hypothetical protein